MGFDLESILFSKSSLLIAAGTFGIIIVGYCIHFDQQRRKDPNYQKKIIERRRAYRSKCHHEEIPTFPSMNNHEAIQDFFLREVQLGEVLLGRGDKDGGIQHFCNAVAISGQPQQLLEVLKHTLPPALFNNLIERLPEAIERLTEARESTELGNLEQ